MKGVEVQTLTCKALLTPVGDQDISAVEEVEECLTALLRAGVEREALHEGFLKFPHRVNVH
ncbi:MAG: hypothetical protein ACTJGR_08425, partial [Pauljensenia sp.]